MARVVIDANVLVSAAFGGVPLDAVSRAFRRGKVFVSPATVEEIELTIGRLSPKLGAERTEVLRELWSRFFSLCEACDPHASVSLCRDPKDDAYLSLCASAAADYLVTGDRDLLSVDVAQGGPLIAKLKIVTPREFLDMAE